MYVNSYEKPTIFGNATQLLKVNKDLSRETIKEIFVFSRKESEIYNLWSGNQLA